MIAFAAAALIAGSTPAPAAAIESAQTELVAAHGAYTRCMRSQAADDDDQTGLERPEPAMGICRAALETLVEAQQRWIEVAQLSDADRREARQNLARLRRELHEEALGPLRAMRNY